MWVGGASAALALVASCATGVVPEDDDDGGSGAGKPNGPLPGFQYSQGLTIADATPAEVAVSFDLDHATLVADGKARADGEDVRVTYETPDGTVIQLDRVLDPFSEWGSGTTRLWVRTEALVDGSGSYVIYYGDEDASSAPADGSAVYDYWDDFEGAQLDSGWVFSGLGGATGMVTQEGGALRITATGQDFGGTSDQVGLALREVSGDFRVEVEVRAAGGSIGGLSKAGGLTLRQSVADGARHATIAIQQTPDQRVGLFRAMDDDTTTNMGIDHSDNYPHMLRLERTASNLVSVSYRTSGSWLQLGSAQTFTQPLTDPVFIGVPFANNSGGNGWAELEWIRLNKVVTPTPTASPDGDEKEY